MISEIRKTEEGFYIKATHGELSMDTMVDCATDELREHIEALEEALWNNVQEGIQESWSNRWRLDE